MEGLQYPYGFEKLWFKTGSSKPYGIFSRFTIYPLAFSVPAKSYLLISASEFQDGIFIGNEHRGFLGILYQLAVFSPITNAKMKEM